MHIVIVKKNQILHRYAKRGTGLHLSAGRLAIQETPVYLDHAIALACEVLLPEGGVYRVKKSGWIRIRAIQPSEVLLQEVEAPGRFRLFWRQCRLVLG